MQIVNKGHQQLPLGLLDHLWQIHLLQSQQELHHFGDLNMEGLQKNAFRCLRILDLLKMSMTLSINANNQAKKESGDLVIEFLKAMIQELKF